MDTTLKVGDRVVVINPNLLSLKLGQISHITELSGVEGVVRCNASDGFYYSQSFRLVTPLDEELV